MLKEVDQKTLQAAIKALKINAPIYSAIRIKDGSIRITTRNGIQTWKPPKPKAKAEKPKPKSQKKPTAKSGGKK